MEHQRENSVEREKKEIHTHTHTLKEEIMEKRPKKKKEIKRGERENAYWGQLHGARVSNVIPFPARWKSS